jgi:hypothetical protein
MGLHASSRHRLQSQSGEKAMSHARVLLADDRSVCWPKHFGRNRRNRNSKISARCACRLQAVEGIIRTLKQRAIVLLVRERAVVFACEGDG